MGTWDIGPFENDMAADFAGTLDDIAMAEREDVVRSALTLTIQTQGYLESPEGAEAVAAAALIAAQCPDGTPITSSYGPDEPLPVFSGRLRVLAVAALDRVLAEQSELADLWAETVDGPRWRHSIGLLREVLDPSPKPHGEPTLEIRI